jgi:hypothetical protein
VSESPTVTMSGDRQRPTSRQQIEEVLVRARLKNEPLRVRLPFTLYDHDVTRTYVVLRDTAWNISLPQASVEGVEDLIGTISLCLNEIILRGTASVRARLEEAQP